MGSKLVAFVLVPLYTHFLTATEFGFLDIILTTNQLLIPFTSLSIAEAAFRFAIDDKSQKNLTNIFSNSLFVSAIGCLLLILLFPILQVLNIFMLYIYVIVVLTVFQMLCSRFLKAIGNMTAFAINGIIMALSLAISNIILLIGFDLGVRGYLFSVIISTIIALIHLVFAGKLYKYVSLKEITPKIQKEMLAYSLPLIPNAFAWWINNAADRYLLFFFLGSAATGIYAVANQMPSIIKTFSSVFSQSWQISAIEEYDSKERGEFYTTVFSAFSQGLFVLISVIIITLMVYSNFIAASFATFWRYTPFLLVGVMYSSFSAFLGTIYLAIKKTKNILWTTLLGSVINIGINIYLIPRVGINGAAVATMVSFLIVWVVRHYDVKKYLWYKLDSKNIIFSHIVLFLQIAVVYLLDGVAMYFCLGLALVAMVLANFELVVVVKSKFLGRK